MNATVKLSYGPQNWLKALDLMRLLRKHGIGVWADPLPDEEPRLSPRGLNEFRDRFHGKVIRHNFTDEPVQQQFETVYMQLYGQDLQDIGVLVTAGPTVEDIDPVRFISNRSSGRMGIAIAAAAARRGANVLLIRGPINLPVPSVKNLTVVPVRSALQMRDAVMANVADIKVAILCAAVADFSPAQRAAQKIKKHDRESMQLKLIRTPDILAELGSKQSRPLLVGFAAESENVLEHARDKLLQKNCDLICANDISTADSGFEVDQNRITILHRDGTALDLPLQSKDAVAHGILDVISQKLRSNLI